MGNGSADHKMQAEMSAGEWARTGVQIVAVGDKEGWLASHDALPTTPNIAYVGIEDVTRELLDTLAPELIVSPVVSYTFDCIDLALALSELGFERSYRAIGRDLPRPEMIENEIRQLCRGLDFEVLAGS